MSLESAQQRVELILNEIAADQDVFKIFLQCFVINMLQGHPKGPELLAGMKAQMLGSIAQTMPNPDDPQGRERGVQMRLMRVETLFQELEAVVGKAETPSPTRGAN